MLRKAIQGTWDLVSYTAQDNPGGPTTYPLGPDALGLIMYTGDGYRSAQLMRRGRPAFDVLSQMEAPPNRPLPRPPVTSPTALPFEVEESTGVVHHNVRVSLLPNWLNGTRLRHSKLDGDRLTLSAITAAPDGIETISTLVWKCVPDTPPNSCNQTLATGRRAECADLMAANYAGVTWGTIQHQFGDADGVWTAVLDRRAEIPLERWSTRRCQPCGSSVIAAPHSAPGLIRLGCRASMPS